MILFLKNEDIQKKDLFFGKTIKIQYTVQPLLILKKISKTTSALTSENILKPNYATANIFSLD